MLPRDQAEPFAQRVVAVTVSQRLMPLSGAVLTGDLARPPLRQAESLNQHRDRGTSTRRAQKFPFAISFNAWFSRT